MLKEVYGLQRNNDFNQKNYTLILSKPDEPLVQYVNENMEEYIRIVIDNCIDNITDDEPSALVILNNPDVDSNNKEEYIGFLQTKLEYLGDVEEKDLWSLLLQKKLVNYSEANILYYFFRSAKGLDAFLVAFINGQNNRLNFETKSINELNDYLSLFEGKRPKFVVSNINHSLLTSFKKKNWITRFDIDKDNESYYRAYGRRVYKDLEPELL